MEFASQRISRFHKEMRFLQAILRVHGFVVDLSQVPKEGVTNYGLVHCWKNNYVKNLLF